MKNKAAQQLGRLGGLAKSAAKSAAVRENGKLGGRPKKPKQNPVTGHQGIVTKIFIIALIAAANFSFGQTNYTIKAGDFVVDISTVKVKESPIWIGQWKGSLVLCPVLQVTNVNTNGPYTTLQFSSKLNGRFGSYDPFPAVALFLPYTNSPAPKEAVVLVEKPLKIIYTDPNRSVCISGSEPEVRQVGTQWLIEYGP